MLKITTRDREFFDSDTNEFRIIPSISVCLEHSLVSMSKWESKYKKPFLSSEKSREEISDYISMMRLDDDDNDDWVMLLDRDSLNDITEYIKDSQTATTFSETNESGPEAVVTSEILYYWMTVFNIPFECETWHINRLVTLIRVCSIKSQPQKKMSEQEVARRQHELNKARLADLSKG